MDKSPIFKCNECGSYVRMDVDDLNKSPVCSERESDLPIPTFEEFRNTTLREIESLLSHCFIGYLRDKRNLPEEKAESILGKPEFTSEMDATVTKWLKIDIGLGADPKPNAGLFNVRFERNAMY